MQKLGEEIRVRNATLGSTATGSDWCIKALHPSDPLTEVRGIPDHSAVPSLLMNYQGTYKVSPNTGAMGTWSFEASLLPHPIQFMYLDKFDSINPNGMEYSFLNQQLGASTLTHSERYDAFLATAQRFRLAYMSVTCYQDGPDLANQGTIVVSQPPVEGSKYSWCHIKPSGDMAAATQTVSYSQEDRPSFNSSQSMPNAYFSKSKEGAYVPLKLTKSCQDWHSEADSVGIAQIGKTANSSIVTLSNTSLPQFPHVDLLPTTYNNGIYILSGQRTAPMLNNTWAHISAQNLSVGTSFSFFVRCGIEIQVSPSSTLAPQLKLSPPHDALALETYFAVARELKDGYPSDYNDLGKIWGNISTALQAVSPIINAALPGSGAIISGSAALGDFIAKSRRASREKPSKAEVERVVKTPPKPRPRRRSKKNKARPQQPAKK